MVWFEVFLLVATIACCEAVTCRSPTNHDVGAIPIDSQLFPIGSRLIYKCKPCYTLVGPSTIECKFSQTWTHQPKCILNKCPSFKDSNTGITLGEREYGDFYQFACHHPLVLRGASKITCNCDGTWSSEPPSCIKMNKTKTAPAQQPKPIPGLLSCQPLTPIKNGRFFVRRITSTPRTTLLPGDAVKYVCKSRFLLVGKVIRYCMPDSKWNADAPICKARYCGVINTVKDGLVKGSNIINEHLAFSCNTGFRLQGPPSIACLESGRWSQRPPICKARSCDEINTVKHGLVKGSNIVNEHLAFSCNIGFRLQGPSSITCLESERWSQTPPICKDVCEDFPCAAGMKCVFDVILNLPKCVCKGPMDCSSLYTPICASDTNVYNNECRMHAAACHQNEEIVKVSDGWCKPVDRCLFAPAGACKALFTVYAFNSDTRKCEKTVVGGCHSSGWNGYASESKCNEDCFGMCDQVTDPGPCNLSMDRWAYNMTTNSCQPFTFGGCIGNSNNFASEDQCTKFCQTTI